jgi:hypothetical protein
MAEADCGGVTLRVAHLEPQMQLGVHRDSGQAEAKMMAFDNRRAAYIDGT